MFSGFSKFLIFSLFGLGACATPLRINVPAMRLESPEVEDSKTRAFTFTGGLQSYNVAELSPDLNTVMVNSVPVVTRQAFINQHPDDLTSAFDFNFLFMRLGYSFPIPLEITYRFPDRLGLKYQFLGPRASQALSGDFSAALTISYTKRSTEGSQIDPGSSNTSSYSFERELTDAALIVGLRVADEWLLYGGPFIETSPFTIEQKTYSMPAAAKIEGQVNTFGGNLGMQWRAPRDDFMIRLEAVVNRLEAHNHARTYLNGGLAFSKAF